MSTKRALVVGSGAVGLRVALELIKRNAQVTLRSPRHPLDLSGCSVGAGGLWMPSHLKDPRVDAWALETLNELLALPQEGEDEEDPGANELVEMMYAIDLKTEHSGPLVEDFTSNQYTNTPGTHTNSAKLPAWTRDPRLRFQHLSIEMLAWQNLSLRLRIPPEHELKEAGYMYAWLWYTPIVNAPKMLEHYLNQVSLKSDADVDVETGHEYESLEEMIHDARSLGCDAVFNCTGVGAAQICQEDEDHKDGLYGGRGVMLQYDRSKVVRRDEVVKNLYGDNLHDCVFRTTVGSWVSPGTQCNLIPRGDILNVGGTMLKGDSELGIRDTERQQLLINAERLGIDTKQSSPIGEWTGFRPYRASGVRVELDSKYSNDHIKVIHNYGHGGSGWTINAGTARESVDLLFNC